MRVIEPHPQRVRRKSHGLGVVLGLTGLVVIILGGFLYKLRNHELKPILGEASQNNAAQSARTDNGMKFLSAYDFQKIYDQTAYPNTQQLNEPPVITGNESADLRIRHIAESRGFKLQVVPTQVIVKVEDIADQSSNLLQPLAQEGWLKLKDLANQEKIPLKAKYGYQSIDKQRELFLQKLNGEGINVDKIVKGEVDDKIITSMYAVAPPGYSRNHTGYAIDLYCDTPGSGSFELSKCSNWLKDNNFAKAKQSGFVPSRVEKIGPPSSDTQTVELVWVGTSSFY